MAVLEQGVGYQAERALMDARPQGMQAQLTPRGCIVDNGIHPLPGQAAVIDERGWRKPDGRFRSHIVPMIFFFRTFIANGFAVPLDHLEPRL